LVAPREEYYFLIGLFYMQNLFSGGRVRVMGILNVTPDSFSDGGRLLTEDALIDQAAAMVTAGVDIFDIGGESSRPFSDPVSVDDELARVIPAIEAVRKRFAQPISIDTTKAVVARAALDAGAEIINDISAFRFDPGMVSLAAETDVPIIFMHMLGTPKDMQKDPSYNDVIGEIKAFFDERLGFLDAHGIGRDRVILDPGIGFGKTLDHNLTILKHLHRFTTLGCPLLVGHSRKAFIGMVLDRQVADRDVATAAVSALCVEKGVAILRVHDVDKTVQAVRMAEAVLNAAD
jgi:dihydropteroate synthase